MHAFTYSLLLLFFIAALAPTHYAEGFSIFGSKKHDCLQSGSEYRCVDRATEHCYKPAGENYHGCQQGEICCARQCRQASDCAPCRAGCKTQCILTGHKCVCSCKHKHG